LKVSELFLEEGIMKNLLQSHVFTTGLAIFSMLFGAGNIMYPLYVGMDGGQYTPVAMVAFLLTAVVLPIIGLVAMILYDGDYTTFFNRLSEPIGAFFILSCMLIIGPLIVIPRIVTLSHTMLAPYLSCFSLGQINPITSGIFALFFLTVTFFLTYRENKIVDVLGFVISPLLLLSLSTIIVLSFFGDKQLVITNKAPALLFTKNLLLGYRTLDLLATLFFASIIFNILSKNLGKEFESSRAMRVKIGLQSGTIGVALLGLVYCGMSYLGAYYGTGLSAINEGEIFREVSTRVLGPYGALVIALAVLMACFSTAVAVSAVVAEYLQHTITKERLGFVLCLLLVLLFSLPLSIAGLSHVLALTAGPIIYIGYPMVITLTFCNLAYKIIGFKPVKIPVLLIFILTTLSYIWS
jgi:branched-chain amino acid:cation transporter, LIVCS family